MKERTLNIVRNEDKTIVEDKDGKMLKDVTKAFNDITFNLSYCHEQLKKGALTVGMKENHLALSEHYLIDFLKIMDYDSILGKEMEERHANIKSLNIENRELRKQLGEKVTNEDAREKMKNLSELIRSWWRVKGFGHVSEIKFSEYGSAEVELSGMICSSLLDNKEKKDKEKYLIDLGFGIDDGDVVFNDECLRLLGVLITEQYPSAFITETRVWHGRREASKLRGIHIIIQNLDDITPPE